MNYGTIAQFKSYHASRGRDYSATLDGVITASLLVASEWIDATFRNYFNGLKTGGQSQVREWPRTGAIDTYGFGIVSNVVPEQIENATYEAAAKQIANPDAFNVDYTPSKYKRASVDGAVSVDYASFASASETQTQFPIVYQVLSTLLSSSTEVSVYSGSSSRV